MTINIVAAGAIDRFGYTNTLQECLEFIRGVNLKKTAILATLLIALAVIAAGCGSSGSPVADSGPVSSTSTTLVATSMPPTTKAAQTTTSRRTTTTINNGRTLAKQIDEIFRQVWHLLQ